MKKIILLFCLWPTLSYGQAFLSQTACYLSGSTTACIKPVDITGGGTGAITAQAAINALAGATTDDRVLQGNGTNIVLGQIDATTFFTSGAYNDGSNAGTLPIVTAMSNSLATQLGLKNYVHGTTYNGGNAPTVTLSAGGGSLTTVDFSAFIPYEMQDAIWRLRFNLIVTLSSATRTQVSLDIAGVTFKNTSGSANGQTVIGVIDGNAANYRAFALKNTGTITEFFPSVSTAQMLFSGDVELASKPTWAY